MQSALQIPVVTALNKSKDRQSFTGVYRAFVKAIADDCAVLSQT